MHAAARRAHPPLIARAVNDPRAFDESLRLVAEQRDRAAFSRLFDHYAPRLKGYLMRSGSNPEAAEELAQEAMMTLWRKAHLFDPRRASASAWIFTIARNLQIDAFRRGSSAIYAFDPAFDAEAPAQPDVALLSLQAA